MTFGQLNNAYCEECDGAVQIDERYNANHFPMDIKIVECDVMTHK